MTCSEYAKKGAYKVSEQHGHACMICHSIYLLYYKKMGYSIYQHKPYFVWLRLTAAMSPWLRKEAAIQPVCLLYPWGGNFSHHSNKIAKLKLLLSCTLRVCSQVSCEMALLIGCLLKKKKAFRFVNSVTFHHIHSYKQYFYFEIRFNKI